MAKVAKYTMLCCLLFTSIAVNKVHAQLSRAREIIQEIYKKYDSLNNLSFDVQYNYKSDTLYGDYMVDNLYGSYTMSGRKARFTMAEIEYMQNDSFFVAVYSKEKMIIVSDPQNINAGSFLPMRSVIDSLMQSYAAHYEIAVNELPGDSIHNITFFARDSLAPFRKYTIRFSAGYNLITALQYDYTENRGIYHNNENITPDDSLYQYPRNITLNISFGNYRFSNSLAEDYDENNYVWYEAGTYKPVERYANFRVYSTKAR
jgi:hypothetical protein